MKYKLILFVTAFVFSGCTTSSDLFDELNPTKETSLDVSGNKTPEPSPKPTMYTMNPADARLSDYIGGNISPELQAGDPGTISIISIGKYKGSVLPIVVRNNTSQSVIRIAVSAVARASDGSMLASGGDQGFNPNFVNPGEISMGYIYFGYDIKLPDDVTFEFESTAENSVSDFAEFENIRDLEVVELNYVDNRVVGSLRNSHNEIVGGPIDVVVFCFAEEGRLLGQYSNFTDKEKAEPNDTIPFQVQIYDDQCPIYLVAAYGFEE